MKQDDSINIRTHYSDREDQRHHLIDAKLLLITCIKNTLSC